MVAGDLKLAVITECFFGPDGPARLEERLHQARATGAELAALPELPLNEWSPATERQQADDAEPPDGPRSRTLARAAKGAGIGLLGGVILQDAADGRRYSTALLLDRCGELVGSYEKLHLPDEEGFREKAHYEPGRRPPVPINGFGLRVGVQVCSDVNRPQGSHLLSARGAEVILNPRATEAATWQRWKTVLMANALTSCCFVASINRTGPERGVAIGGPSFVVDPSGRVLLETTEPLAVVTLERATLEEARRRYPGYLDVFPGIYRQGWEAAERESE